MVEITSVRDGDLLILSGVVLALTRRTSGCAWPRPGSSSAIVGDGDGGTRERVMQPSVAPPLEGVDLAGETQAAPRFAIPAMLPSESLFWVNPLRCRVRDGSKSGNPLPVSGTPAD